LFPGPPDVILPMHRPQRVNRHELPTPDATQDDEPRASITFAAYCAQKFEPRA
jgi:hypothetical protein